MIRKTIWGAIFVNSALALAFAIYTVVAIATGLGAKKSSPSATEVTLALRVNEEFVTESGEITFDGMNGELEKVNGKYIAKLADDNKFKCTVAKSDKSKIVYDVTVYDYGTGSLETPYNITKASDFADLDGNGADIHDNLSACYVLCGDIDMQGVDWIPVGTRHPVSFTDQIYNNNGTYSKIVDSQQNSKFTGRFDANGYTIKNLTINVTRENLNKYIVYEYATNGTTCSVSYAYLEVGFFGCVDMGASVLNAKFENAIITMSDDILNGTFAGIDVEDENYPAENKTIILKCAANASNDGATGVLVSFGVIAGSVANSTVKDITIENSELTAGTGNGIYSGIGMLTGVARFADISNITINNSELVANAKLTYAGGVVGLVEHDHKTENASYYFINVDDKTNKQSKLSNVNILGLTIKGDSYSQSETGGLVGLASGAIISDVVANNLNISLLGGYDDNIGSTTIAGAVGTLYNVKTQNGTELNASLTNVEINAQINAADAKNVWNIAAGVVSDCASKLENVSFTGSIKGSVVAGIVWQNEGEVVYTEDFDGVAVDAEVEYKTIAAGIACYNYGGSIKGATGEKPAIVKFKATNANLQNQNACAAGIAVYSFAGTIENISVSELKSYKTVNFGGAVCYFADKASETIVSSVLTFNTVDGKTTYTYGAELTLAGENKASNINVVADVVTKTFGEGAYTERVGGFAAVVKGNSDIKNIDVILNVNQLNKNADCYAYMVAGLIAEVNGETIGIDGVNIKAKIFINKSGTKVNSKDTSFAAGAIVLVSGSDISIDKVVISSSEIENVIGRGVTDESVNAASGSYAFIARAEATAQDEIAIDNVTISSTNIIAHFNASKQVISTNVNNYAAVGENVVIGEEDVVAVSDVNS